MNKYQLSGAIELISRSCICRYYAYGEIRTAVIEHEINLHKINADEISSNTVDRHSVAVKKDSSITIGCLFSMNGGTITAIVTGQ